MFYMGTGFRTCSKHSTDYVYDCAASREAFGVVLDVWFEWFEHVLVILLSLLGKVVVKDV